MYPRIDILRISIILMDTDRIRIVLSLFEQIQGYFVTDILQRYIMSVFYLMFYFYFYSLLSNCQH